jgi:hypothetical protein
MVPKDMIWHLGAGAIRRTLCRRETIVAKAQMLEVNASRDAWLHTQHYFTASLLDVTWKAVLLTEYVEV